MSLLKHQNLDRRNALLSGVLYLLIAVIGGFSIGYVPGEIVSEGNATQTFHNLLDNQILFKMGITGDIIVMIFEVVLTVLLYRLFKAASPVGMTIATYSRMAMAIVMGVNLINYMIPVIIMGQPTFLNAFSAEELESLNLLFFKAHRYGELAWQLFFAVHLFTLGYVLRKSGKTSKWLGILMLLGGIGYGGDSFIQFTTMNSQVLTILFSTLLVLAVIGELWFAIWLIVKGNKEPKIA